MSNPIESVIDNMIKEGYTSKEINCFLRGLHEGMEAVMVTLDGAKMEVTPEETDPLYIHTWNDVVDAVCDTLDEVIENTFKDLDKTDETN